MGPALASLVDLDGRVAVVTGAAQGIGAAIASRLREAGATVVLTDLGEHLRQTRDRLASTPGAGAVAGIVADAGVEADQDRVARDTLADHGRLDIWVNNAGVFPVHDSLTMTEADWRSVFRVNVDGTFFGARAAGRAMTAAGRGVILNLASTSAFRVSNDGVAHYAASKSAVQGLTRALAREYGPAGVRVLAIAPVLTATESTQASLDHVAAAQPRPATGAELLAGYAERVPLRRVALPDDIARVALFCVSDLAGYVTGCTIPVDGGYLAV